MSWSGLITSCSFATAVVEPTAPHFSDLNSPSVGPVPVAPGLTRTAIGAV